MCVPFHILLLTAYGASYLETDEVQRAMFRIGPVHARYNGLGVSGAELERTARYRDLSYARTGIGYRRSHRNNSRACAYPVGINRRSLDASTPHGIPGGRRVIPQVCAHA